MIGRSLKPLSAAFVAMLAGVYCLTSATAETVNLEQVGRQLNIDKEKISVSGVSAGGAMAHQFHVAHSAHIMGVGVVAGVPYMCAQGDIRLGIAYCTKFLRVFWESMRPYCVFGSKGCDYLTDLPAGRTWFKPSSQNIPSIEVEFKSFEYVGPDDGESEKAKLLAKILADQTKNLQGIDDYENVKKANVFLFHNRQDNKIPKAMMDAVYYFYKEFGVRDDRMTYNRIPIDRALPERHAFVTDNFYKVPFISNQPLISKCNQHTTSDPYIDDCSCSAVRQIANETCAILRPSTPCDIASDDARAFCAAQSDADLAGQILKNIYRDEIHERIAVVSDSELGQYPVCAKENMPEYQKRNCILGAEKIKKFLQWDFVDNRTANLESFATYGYLFVPEDCVKAQTGPTQPTRPKCKLHVAFHGCEQGGETDRTDNSNLFAKYAGYNEWAASNNIVVLYPQVQPNPWSLLGAPPLNEYGCYDLWGLFYTGADTYYLQKGKQISAVAKMINALLAETVFPVPSD